MYQNQNISSQINQCEQILSQLMGQTQQASQMYQQMLQQEQQNAIVLEQLVQKERQAAQIIQSALQGHQIAMQQMDQISQICRSLEQNLQDNVIANQQQRFDSYQNTRYRN